MSNRKAIFDTVRDAARPGVFSDAANVAALDRLLDGFGVPRADGGGRRAINAAGLRIIKDFEGCRLTAYPDPGTGGEPFTIGIGTTVYPDGRKVRKGDTITQAQADAYLAHDLAQFENAVAKLVGDNATDNQFSALVSFAYNVGVGALRTSTLLRKHNEGDYAGARAEFGKWVNAGGKRMPGLVRRRAAEAKLYQGE